MQRNLQAMYRSHSIFSLRYVQLSRIFMLVSGRRNSAEESRIVSDASNVRRVPFLSRSDVETMTSDGSHRRFSYHDPHSYDGSLIFYHRPRTILFCLSDIGANEDGRCPAFARLYIDIARTHTKLKACEA